MKRQACCLALAVAALVPAAIPPQEFAVVADEAPQFAVHAIDDVVSQAAEAGKAWLGFLDEPSMLAGVYRLPEGGQDDQKPHDLDEIYYVVRGKATFEVAGERRPARTGDVLYVAAEVEHRFVDIEEELVLLVVFPKAARPG